MGSSIILIVVCALGGYAFGLLTGWLMQTQLANRREDQLTVDFQHELRTLSDQNADLTDKCTRSQSTVEQLEVANAEYAAEAASVVNKARLLAKSVRTLRTEREHTKTKLGDMQSAFASLRQQTAALQREFEKSREFYKRELLKSLQRRKDLEKDAADARSEQEAFARAVESSVLEHGSPENMMMAAQLRLGQIDVLERTVKKLEAENEELRQDARQIKQKLEAKKKDLTALEELKAHNAQLVRHVEALEDSRKAHEADAERYREQADESEKLSDTLRLKLEDLEQNFADMEKEQHDALEDAREAAVVPIVRKQG